MYQGLKKNYFRNVLGNNRKLFKLPLKEIAVSETIQFTSGDAYEKQLATEMDNVVEKIVMTL